MIKLVIQNGQGQAQEVELKPGINRFGRGPGNDCVLADQGVSEQHAEILVEREFVFVRDLESTNGTFVNGTAVRRSALYPGQIVRMGPVEMVLEAPEVSLAIPELPKPEAEIPVAAPVTLSDGHPSCVVHTARHAVWDCPHCNKLYCDECIRRLRRVGGDYLKLCPTCSRPAEYTAWAEMMRKKKKSFFGSLVSKIADGIKGTTRPLTGPPPGPDTQ